METIKIFLVVWSLQQPHAPIKTTEMPDMETCQAQIKEYRAAADETPACEQVTYYQ